MESQRTRSVGPGGGARRRGALPVEAGVDGALVSEEFARKVVGEGDLNGEGGGQNVDHFRRVEAEAVAGRNQRVEPEPAQLGGPDAPLAQQGLAIEVVQVPQLHVHCPRGLEDIAFWVDGLDVDDERLAFAIVVRVVKIREPADTNALELIPVLAFVLR